jgi:hypothetical protein
MGEEWAAALHRLAWSIDDPVLRAFRFRFHRSPEAGNAVIRVDYVDAMASDPEMMCAPLRVHGQFVVQLRVHPPVQRRYDGRGPLAFPHGFLSVLGPDVFRASALAIDAMLDGADAIRPKATPLADSPATPPATGSPEMTTGQSAGATAGESPGSTVDVEWLKAALESVVDENAIAIINVAQDTTRTADQKMRDIYAIDNRVVGWNSPKWARVLRVKDAAIRQTEWWKEERKRLAR